MAAEATPLLERKMRIPAAPFGRALTQSTGGRIPQTIAHRGYKAAFPENTLGAFQGAVEIGAHAIETDLHLSKDKVVVLSHDATLKRCFGENTKLADCDWDYLSTLRTLKEPKQPMPRLVDLLEYLAQPEQQHIWILLDIKIDDDPDELLGQTAKAFASVPSARPWNQRIVMGAWNENYVKLCKEYFPDFHVANIAFSLVYAARFFKDPGVDFNMFQQTLVGPLGNRFLQRARKAERNVYVWTVNKEQWMEWSIKNEVDGVITDDPKLFLEVSDRWREGQRLGNGAALRKTTLWTRLQMMGQAVLVQILTTIMYLMMYRRLATSGRRKQAAPPTV